jgi:hypothetical protein
MSQDENGLKLTKEQMGAIAAVWHWAEFTNQELRGATILGGRSEGEPTRVTVWLTTPGGRRKKTLSVRYGYWGSLEDEKGNEWSFSKDERGLRFREVH